MYTDIRLVKGFGQLFETEVGGKMSVVHRYRRGYVDIGSYNLSDSDHAECACIIYDKSRLSSLLLSLSVARTTMTCIHRLLSTENPVGM